MKLLAALSLPAFGLAALLAGGALQAQTPPATPTEPQLFAERAASSNAFEIESSSLALQALERAGLETDQPLVDFAQAMVRDHNEAQEQLHLAAAADGVIVPAEIDDRHTATLDSLKTASTGENFRSAYVTAQVDAHEESVALFTAFAADGPEGALKDFAAKTLPVLQQHEEHIKTLDRR